MLLTKHQTKQMESVKACVLNLTVSVCTWPLDNVDLSVARLGKQVKPGASEGDTVSPSLSPTMRMSFNVGKCGYSWPAERFNEPH